MYKHIRCRERQYNKNVLSVAIWLSTLEDKYCVPQVMIVQVSEIH